MFIKTLWTESKRKDDFTLGLTKTVPPISSSSTNCLGDLGRVISPVSASICHLLIGHGQNCSQHCPFTVWTYGMSAKCLMLYFWCAKCPGDQSNTYHGSEAPKVAPGPASGAVTSRQQWCCLARWPHPLLHSLRICLKLSKEVDKKSSSNKFVCYYDYFRFWHVKQIMQGTKYHRVIQEMLHFSRVFLKKIRNRITQLP